MDTDVVVRRDPRGKPVRDKLRVHRPATFLAVVVRARAAGEEAEAVHRRQLGAERVRDAVLEPADHSCAPARQQDPVLPRLPEDLVEAVRTPDRDRVGGAAPGDEDHVVCERQPA